MICSAFSADMPQRFLDHLIHELRRDLKIHPPILNAGDRKQIFPPDRSTTVHHQKYPYRSLSVFLHPAFPHWRADYLHCLRDMEVSGVRKIMGNGSQQICPELFILCMNSGLPFPAQCDGFPLPMRIQLLTDSRTLFSNVSMERSDRSMPITPNTPLPRLNRKVQSFCIGAVIRRCTWNASYLQSTTQRHCVPAQESKLSRLLSSTVLKICPCPREPSCSGYTIRFRFSSLVAALPSGIKFRLRWSLSAKPVGIKQHLRPKRRLCRHFCLIFQPGRQRTGDDGRSQHQHNGDLIALHHRHGMSVLAPSGKKL